jgi:hypothetical protein
MRAGLLVFFLSGAYPVWVAWQANRRTSLAHAVSWMLAAWVAWGGLLVYRASPAMGPGCLLPRYLALSLTGCAGVAVLGARRPGVAAWDFVVLGLLIVLLLPLAESLLATGAPLGWFRRLFLGAVLAVGLLNYLPTRLGLAALALGLGCVTEFMVLVDATASASAEARQTLGWLALDLVPWLGFLGWRVAPRARSAFDQRWQDFRDRFGLVWGQRVREQFNRAAANAGWPVHLNWRGVRLSAGAVPPGPEMQQAMAATLRALLKRFSGDVDAGTQA